VTSKKREIITHEHPDGSVVVTAELSDGRVLRVVGVRPTRASTREGQEYLEARRKQEPYDELYKTLFLLGWRSAT
jgi:hypothetical protein